MSAFNFTLKGTTEQGHEIDRRASIADAPFLSAKFWEKGSQIVARVLESRKTQNGPTVTLELISPESVEVYGNGGELQERDVVRIGNLTGFSKARRAALKEQKPGYFIEGDVLQITCTGISAAEKEGHNDSPNFEIAVHEPRPKVSTPF